MKIILIVMLAGIFFTAGAWDTLAGDYKMPEAVSQVKNRMNVTVHPQVELISIVQAIGNYPSILGFLMADTVFNYKTDVEIQFSPYKEHPVVKMFDRLSSRPGMLNFSAPSNIMLYTDDALRLREDILPDDFVLARAGGKDSLLVFLALLRDFAIQSGFNQFYQSHRDYYSSLINKTVDNLGAQNYISELETFYGKEQKSYSIILVSLYNHVGFGNSMMYPDDRRDLYCTLGAGKVKDGLPDFGNPDYLKYMIRHEFSHPFVNSLTEKYWDYIKDYASKYDSIPEKARKQMCGDWQECINEFVIRAVTTHLACNESEETGKWAYEKEKARGVSNLDSLLGIIEIYSSNRSAWPELNSYYPKILDSFRIQ